MTKPILSVIIPTFRPKNFVALARSMADNSEADAEWIVVDDGSGPEFEAVFNLLPDGMSLIRSSENRRQGAARNIGLAQARGKWIKFLDADDRLDKGHLAALLAATQEGGPIPFAPTRHVFPSGETTINEGWRHVAQAPEVQLASLLRRPFVHHCGALFPKDLLLDLGGYDETLITDEDGDLLSRILMSGRSFKAVPAVQYYYTHHTSYERVSSDSGNAKLSARLRVCDKVEVALSQDGTPIPGPIRHALALRLDKIAMAYWNDDRSAARAALQRAERIYPGYRPEGRWIVRMLRALGGPTAVMTVTRLYRAIRGRPAGGAQG